MSDKEKSSEYSRHLANKTAVLAIEFKRFVTNARGRLAQYTDALTWFNANCAFDSAGNCYYHGGRPKDHHMFIPIDLAFADKDAPYAELILHERELHLNRLKKELH